MITEHGNVMANEIKLSASIEDQLQGLAGDIYLQLEDKFVELLVQAKDENNLITEQVSEASQNTVNTLTEQLAQLELDHQISLKKQQDMAVSFDQDIQIYLDKIKQLTQQLNENEQTNSLELSTLLTELTAEKNQLQSEITQYAENISGLENKNEKLAQEDTAAKQTIEAHTNNITLLEQQLSEQKAELAIAQTDAAKVLQMKEKVIEKLEREFSESQEKIQHDKEKIAQQKQHISQLNQEQKSAFKRLADKDKVLLDNDQQIIDLEKNISSLNEALTNKNDTYTALETISEKTKLTLQEQLATQQEKFNELQTTHNNLIHTSEQNISQLTKQAQNQAKQIASLEKDYAEQINQVDPLIEKVESLTRELNQQTKKRVEENEQQQKNEASLNIVINELTVDKETLIKTASDDHRYIATLEEQLKQVNEHVNKQQDEFEAKQEKKEDDYSKARDTIKYLRDENLELNTRLEQEVGELEEKVTEYRLRFEYAQKLAKG